MSKTILTPQQEREIIDKYVNLKYSKQKLSKEYNISTGTIDRALKRNNIHIRTVQESNISKYYINQNFFEYENQNANSAYVLGLLASDGCVARNENCIYIELQQSDREILEQVNLLLENQREVKDYIRRNGSKNSKLYFFSKKIKDDLAFYDIIPNKTYEADDFVKNIKIEYIGDFLRGFFDGDGSIVNANGTPKWQLDGVCLKTFQHIQKILNEYFSINVNICENTDARSTIPKYRLYCYSQIKCQKIFNLLYKNTNCIKLHRKYNRFLELLK